ncbi:MAG TPA: hypothetical protein VMI54_25450 [Polyangiaceae bacterium]|nr:hypothetical protein [Polyangiaceae bacterium]
MFALRALACVSVALTLAACGGGDDDSSSPSATFGVCDLRTLQETCIEVTGTPNQLVSEKSACEQAPGTWSSNRCPTTPDLIGCCDYTFGEKFHECFYQGTPRTDPVDYCTNSMLWSDGVWTPAGS